MCPAGNNGCTMISMYDDVFVYIYAPFFAGTCFISVASTCPLVAKLRLSMARRVLIYAIRISVRASMRRRDGGWGNKIDVTRAALEDFVQVDHR